MVSSPFLACHLQWKSEKMYKKGVINLSHLKRPSISSFVIFFSFRLHIYNYLNGKNIFFLPLSAEKHYIYHHHLIPSLYIGSHNIIIVEITMLAFASTTNYYEIKFIGMFFFFVFFFNLLLSDIWVGLILVPFVWFFLHCNMLHLLIMTTNLDAGIWRYSIIQSECESWLDLKVCLWKKDCVAC